jgi:hypothetical protein
VGARRPPATGRAAPPPDERREPAREVVAPRRGGAGVRDELAIERARLGLRVGAELGPEVGPQLLEGREGLRAAACRRVGGHQRALRALGERVGGDRLLERGERRGRPGGQLRELQAERGVQLAQRNAPGRGPRLVAVLGQQLARVKVERAHVALRVEGAARRAGRVLEALDVDGGLERHDTVGEAQGVGAHRPPCRVQRLVEVVRGAGGVALGPERLGELVAVQALSRREREELHERARLAQPPGAIRDAAVVDCDGEPAHQTDPCVLSFHRRPSGRPYAQ